MNLMRNALVFIRSKKPVFAQTDKAFSDMFLIGAEGRI